MSKYFEPCPEATCNHTRCLRLREFKNHEQLYGYEISPTTKLTVVCEELNKDNERLVMEKQGLQEDNDKLKESNEAFRVQTQELSNTSGTLSQKVVEIRSKLVEALQEAKQEEASHHSTLDEIRKDHEKAQMKSDTEIEKYRKKCEALKQATVELEEHNRTLATFKLEFEKNAVETAIKVRDLESRVEELEEALINSESYLCTVRESLQEEKNKTEVLQEGKELLVLDKKRLANVLSKHLLDIQESAQQIICAYHTDPLDLPKISESPSQEAKTMDADDEMPTVRRQDSLTTPAAPPGPPTPTSLIETKTTPAPHDDQQQGGANVPPKTTENDPNKAKPTVDRPPPLGPKRSLPPHAEGRRRSRLRRGYDSYRPPGPGLDY